MEGKTNVISQILIVFLLSLSLSEGHASIRKRLNNIPKINVKIGNSLNQIFISGVDLVKNLKGKVKSYKGRKALQFNCKAPSENIVKGNSLLLASVSSPTGLINWQKQKFKGKLNILATPNFNSCDLVNSVSLEDYISSLLSKEMNSKWHIEALKAQAVAARSYAYHMMVTKRVSKNLGMNAHYDVENSEKHQVTGNFFDQTLKTNSASRSTKGQILLNPKGDIVPIFFHSKCGGRTLRPEEVWEGTVSGYKNVDCPFCHKHGKGEWRYKLSKQKFKKIMNRYIKEGRSKTLSNVKNFKSVNIAPDRYKNALLRVYNQDEQLAMMNKSYFRRVLGRSKIPSNYLRVFPGSDSVYLYGEGFGHGVGMCQFGALELAQKGYNYKQILAHYFPKFKLKKIY